MHYTKEQRQAWLAACNNGSALGCTPHEFHDLLLDCEKLDAEKEKFREDLERAIVSGHAAGESAGYAYQEVDSLKMDLAQLLDRADTAEAFLRDIGNATGMVWPEVVIWNEDLLRALLEHSKIAFGWGRGLREELTNTTTALLNLLAIIHRDGGQHTAEVGEEQSVKDAHTVWANLIIAKDNAENERHLDRALCAEHSRRAEQAEARCKALEDDAYTVALAITAERHKDEVKAITARAERAERLERDLRCEIESAFRKHGLAADPRAVDALVEQRDSAIAERDELRTKHDRRQKSHVELLDQRNAAIAERDRLREGVRQAEHVLIESGGRDYQFTIAQQIQHLYAAVDANHARWEASNKAWNDERTEKNAAIARAEKAEREIDVLAERARDYMDHANKAERERDTLAVKVKELEASAKRLSAAHRVALENDAARIRELLAQIAAATSPEGVERAYAATRQINQPVTLEAWMKTAITAALGDTP